VRSAGAAASQRSEPVVVAVVAHYSSSNCMLGSYLVGVITWVCPVIRAVVVIYYYYYVPGPLHDQAKRGLLFFFAGKRKEGFRSKALPSYVRRYARAANANASLLAYY
jgi:hypothetical protein